MSKCAGKGEEKRLYAVTSGFSSSLELQVSPSCCALVELVVEFQKGSVSQGLGGIANLGWWRKTYLLVVK